MQALFLAIFAVVPLAADEPGFSVAGSGLLELPTTATLAPGRVTLGLAVDNADRDPQGIDLFDYDLAGVFGVTPRLELYGRGVFSRVVAMPEPPTLPPPPLDLIVVPGALRPSGPWHSLFFPTPYVNKRGTARFSYFVPGDLLVGAKLRLSEGGGSRPALAGSLEVKVPLTRKLSSLQSGAGTGGVDLAGRLIAEWHLGRTSLVTMARYTWVGSPPFGDRVFMDGIVSDQPLRLPDRLDIGLGLRRRLSRRVAVLAETWTVFDVGGHTPVADQARPLDVLAGLQGSLHRLRLTAGLRYHGHALQSLSVHPSPLAGLVDLTDVAEPDLSSYLKRLGLGAAVADLRPGSQRVLALPANAPPPPADARVIPPTYEIRSEHQFGYVFLVGWSF